MRVIRKVPGRPPELVEMENTLAALQQAVGGYIETVTLSADAAIICNYELFHQSMPHRPAIQLRFPGHLLCRPDPGGGHRWR